MNKRKDLEDLLSDQGTTRISGNKCVSSQAITLDVGGRKFRTTPDTLRAESGLFRRQLSDRFTWTAQDDGSYFLDADPELFEHLLRFMRRPEVFPLFYSRADGIDYDLYNRLEIEACYFQIKSLHDWIKDQMYHQALVVHTQTAHVCDLGEVRPETLSINQTEERHYLSRIRKVYICPRHIPVHRGDPQRCGLACRKAQLGKSVEFEDEHYIVEVRVKKEIEHRVGICRI